MMSKNRMTWNQVFDKFGLIARLTMFIQQKSDFQVHNRLVVLLEIAQELVHSENQAYLACSIYVYMLRLVRR